MKRNAWVPTVIVIPCVFTPSVHASTRVKYLRVCRKCYIIVHTEWIVVGCTIGNLTQSAASVSDFQLIEHLVCECTPRNSQITFTAKICFHRKEKNKDEKHRLKLW